MGYTGGLYVSAELILSATPSVSAELIEKERFNGEMLSWKNAQEADMRMKWQAPTLLWGVQFYWGECGIVHTSAPFSHTPLLLSRGSHGSTHSRVQ
mgnify:CR=1 FL=1